jgi:hypothetical protein
MVLLDLGVLLWRGRLLNAGTLVFAGQSVANVPLTNKLTSSTLLGDQREQASLEGNKKKH